jgi:hypothetical protein
LPLLHIVSAELRDDASPEAIQQALVYAHALATAEGVSAICCGRSATRLLVSIWLDNAQALEPFAASPEHMSFIMRGLATVIRGMWSASVATEDNPPTEAPTALWLFAIPAFEGVFEWEVRRLLDDVAALPGVAWAGPTVEERERYRAGGAVLLTDSEMGTFEEALAAARIGWGSLADHLEQAVAVDLIHHEGRA